jgi:hypothetical protein
MQTWKRGGKINGTELTFNLPKQTSKSYNLKLHSLITMEIILENFNELFTYFYNFTQIYNPFDSSQHSHVPINVFTHPRPSPLHKYLI